jgi:hypothetical protein
LWFVSTQSPAANFTTVELHPTSDISIRAIELSVFPTVPAQILTRRTFSILGVYAKTRNVLPYALVVNQEKIFVQTTLWRETRHDVIPGTIVASTVTPP